MYAGSNKEVFTFTPIFKGKRGANARYSSLSTTYTMPPSRHERVVKVFMPYGIKFQSLAVTYTYDLDGPVLLELNEERKPRNEDASTSAGQYIVKNEENVGDIKPTFKKEPEEVEITLALDNRIEVPVSMKRAKSESPEHIQSESITRCESKRAKTGQHE
ncbi:hypothetical protein J3R83DRAFT_142 [Lanmaoa asiatica]|nr:hypothetical protein J3R83DRAFT_142 [Lanmaoa asiatica]